ncbi:epimerase [Micromonospora globispora]|uniref:Epimerase n=2 Tax=Micromonospora globispora TaxID=1450148 RepID=A0A317K774_9ACTN|nr:epimerase [Micromonospora globispora]PWU60978.1 epimerase [Micromonospora globispora]RQW82850.1 epimerase [Micromonospora globispora]
MTARNPLGIHAAVFAGGWSPEERRMAARRARRAGYDVLEIPALDPEAIDIADTRAVLDEHGLVGVCSLGLDFDADISSPVPEVAARGEARLRAALDVAAGLGGGFLGGVIYSALGKYDRPMDPRDRDSMVAILRRLAARAADEGVTLGLEAVNRYESNAINTCAQAVQVIKDVGAANVVVHLDAYHANIEEASITQAVADCADHLGYVHVGESHRGYLGSGSADLDGLFRALRDTGYSGTVTFESFSRAVVSADLSDRLGVWRDLWEDGDDLAAHAHAYMSERLTRVAGGTTDRRTLPVPLDSEIDC